MTLIRKYLPHGEASVPDGGNAFKNDASRRVSIRCSSAAVDRVGDIIEQRGIDLGPFRRNPIICWQHRHDAPIARAVEIGVAANGCLEAVIEFPQPGISRLADSIYGMIRSDILRGVSVGVHPLESVGLDKGNPKKGPQRIKRCELLEVSIVGVPANTEAGVLWKYGEGDEMARRKAEVARLRAKHEHMVEVLKLAVAP